MKPSLTRRSFVKRASAGLAGISILVTEAKSLYAGAASKTGALALQGGTPVRSKPFSDTWPIIDEREERALLKAVRSRNWCCLRGNAVYDFEAMFAHAMGVPYCVLTNGGTTALSASLHVLGVGPGDEVITTPHTFIATINTITNLYALPVFVDIDPQTGSINADLVEAAITEHTKAILPVHLAGWPVDIEKIMALSKKHGIPVVEDACQSVYAEVNGRKVGTFGKAGCISFQEWKSLVCGEGGAILGSDDEFMRRCAAFINNGRDPKKLEKGYPFPGSNHRMTEFQAAVLTEQFKRFLEQAPLRHQNGRYVEDQMAKIPGLTPRKRYSDNTRVTYVQFEMDYDRSQFKDVPAARFAEALRREHPHAGRSAKIRRGLPQGEDAAGAPEFIGIPGGVLSDPAGQVSPVPESARDGRCRSRCQGDAVHGQQDPLPGLSPGDGSDRRSRAQGLSQPGLAGVRAML